jgi:hypothetical protein
LAGQTIPLTVRPARKRELATAVCDDWSVSIRRACSVLEFDRSTYHYKSRRREQAGLEARIKEIRQTGDQFEEDASDLQPIGAADAQQRRRREE